MMSALIPDIFLLYNINRYMPFEKRVSLNSIFDLVDFFVFSGKLNNFVTRAFSFINLRDFTIVALM